jgi:hypothetical protein
MSADLPSLVVVSGIVVGATWLLFSLLALRVAGLRSGLQRALSGLIGAGIGFAVALLLLDLVFPHLRSPSDWGQLIAGTHIIFAVSLVGTAAGAYFCVSREHASLRRKLAPDLDRHRAEEQKALLDLARMAEKDPTLLPLLQKAEQAALVREQLRRELKLPEAELPIASKGRPPAPL